MKGYILFRFRQAAVALGLVVIAFALRWLLDPVLTDRLPYTFFLLAAIVAAWLTGVAEAAMVMVVGWCLASWFFDEPRHTFAIHGVRDWMNNLSYWFIGGAVLLFAKSQRSALVRELNALVKLRRREAAMAGCRNVFDLAPVGLAEVEPQSGLLLHVNPKLCQLTGFTEEEMVRKRLWELAAPVEGASDWASLSRRLTSGPAGTAVEMRLSRKDGETVRLSLRAALGQDGEKLSPRLICVLAEGVSTPQAVTSALP